MELNDQFHEIFPPIPILGMVHLAGEKPIEQAVEEIALYEELGVDGAIIENYHADKHEVYKTLEACFKRTTELVLGVNVLPNEYNISMHWGDMWGAKFVQVDHVAGRYGKGELNLPGYKAYKKRYPKTVVLGGVWPKYYEPVVNSNLEDDLKQGMERAEAIVVTGSGTGMETPYDKVAKFKGILGTHPLIIGAGLTTENAYQQLSLANGGIVGSSFKVDNDTKRALDPQKIQDFMDIVKQVREER